MPGDLRDPEQTFPFYYDPRYREAPNQFEPGAFNINEYLQSIVEETTGKRLNSDQLQNLRMYLEDKGFFHRNPGSESFRMEVQKRIKRRAMARKVALYYGRFK
ncbi:hypothetical protein DRQ07_10350 [candidate division KSB1 bacterium]|nr:MAG: hypothetical protein DRQ07_10350 [candidate division KSB1 bacterium]